MRFPWQPKLETRSGSYSDALIALLIREADGGSGADNKITAAVEAAAGQIGRAFAAAEVASASATVQAALTPDVLELIGAVDDTRRRLVLLPGYVRRTHPATCHKPLRDGRAYPVDVDLRPVLRRPNQDL